MRILLSLLMVLPSLALAESFPIQSKVSAATVYNGSAAITRTAGLDIPAGLHELVLQDIPFTIEFQTLQVAVAGADLLYVKSQLEEPVFGPLVRSPEYLAAEQVVHALEDQIAALEDEARTLRLADDSAAAEAAFLTGLGRDSDLSATDPESLRALARMIGEETQRARRTALENQERARLIERQLPDLRAELDVAQDTLDAVPQEDRERIKLILGVEAGEDVAGEVTLDYLAFDSAEWTPTYDFSLTLGDTPVLRVERGVFLDQWTGEDWIDVSLVLSTQDPDENLAPRSVGTRRFRLVDPPPPEPNETLAEPVIEAPVIVENAAGGFGAVAEGLAVSYAYDGTISLTSGADFMRLSLDTLEFPVQVYAAVSDTWDETAYLMARFTNTTPEELLVSPYASRSVNGAFVGTDDFAGVVAGDETELAFGPIDGLLVERRVADRSEGDKGVLSRSNLKRESTQIELRNLTGETWPVELTSSVPLSGHDDLIIKWTADPEPTIEGVDNRPGILRWDFDMAPGASRTMTLDTEMSWPTDKQLR